MIGTDAGIEIVNRSESNMGTEIGMGLVQVDETAINETANRIIFCYSVLYVECSGVPRHCFIHRELNNFTCTAILVVYSRLS